MPMALKPVVVLSSLLLLSAAAGRLQAAEPDLRLVTAVAERNEPAVLALLAARVDVNAARPDGATALLWAAHWNDLGLVQRLVRAGAKVSAANDRGMTPLALCVRKRERADGHRTPGARHRSESRARERRDATHDGRPNRQRRGIEEPARPSARA